VFGFAELYNWIEKYEQRTLTNESKRNFISINQGNVIGLRAFPVLGTGC